jgi:hypothetical protein
MDGSVAFARFFTELARAADQLAADLTRPERAPLAIAPPPGLGRRQEEVFRVVASSQAPISTSEISRLIDYDVPNTWMTLRRLEQLRLVELVPGSKPQRWRVRPGS